MSKMSTDALVTLSGPTMGSRWTACLMPPPAASRAALEAALAAAVARVDAQMSLWRPDSDLVRLNAAPVGAWVPLPAELLQVLAAGLENNDETEAAEEIVEEIDADTGDEGSPDASPGEVEALGNNG